ncbi:AAA family ATPase [Pseudomonas sp. UL073]|uniref:AAA family ATPase n=1 Tax=Zestomonas insulae TaxID=2809017 RepID=A0ABS2IM07_9GAMM|nr:LuxR C-terminal-related transcriptional regulator [Pseudomonas insulae]MBM7063005.1 AAA family ATPase [Pseudomonas insulae]
MHIDKQLVSTKFSPPRIGTQTIPRQRLLDELQLMAQCRVGLVIGSPGYGKTTLLAQWRQAMMREGAEVAWLSLSADDRHLSVFFAYLRGALQRLGIPLENRIPLESARQEFIDAMVATIVDGAGSLTKELYLVIDDYQHVADPRAHQLMQKLLDHCPDNLHFVIASRVAPPLSLSRLRLMGQVVELDCGGLPFEPGETRTFLEQNLPALKLSTEELQLIHELTSGWPASLQLIVILLRSNAQARGTLRELVWRSDDLHTYLAEDVMVHLPADMAAFMEGISICRRFNASLAEAVTGSANAQGMLKRLDEENMLIFRVESEERQPWYRFHPLFGEFLATRLERRDPAEVNELHRRAAYWLAEHRLLAEAVRHATQGGDLEFAALVIERAAPASWSLEQLGPLLRLLDRLPQDVLFSRPRLVFLGCMAYALTARPAKAEDWLKQFRRSGAAQPADEDFRLPLVQAAIEIQRDRTDPVIGLLEHFQALSNDYPVTRYGAPILLAIAYSAAGRHAEALRCLDQNPITEADRDSELSLVSEGSRMLCLMLEGRMADAERVGVALLERAIAVHGYRSVSAYLSAANLAEVYREQDRLDESREILANRESLLQWAMPQSMLLASICQARLVLVQESAAAALAFLERQERHFRNLGLDRGLVHCLAEQVRIALLGNDRALAEEHAARLDALAASYTQARGFQAEIPALAALTRARLLLATELPQQALEALATVRRFTTEYHRGQWEVTALLLLAQTSAQEPQWLLQAIEAGERLGLVRTFLDEGPAVQRLLASVAEQLPSDRQRDYVQMLLARFGQGKLAHAVEADGAAAPAVLTPRELAILQLIGKAMSNKLVALTLNISLETVKWNLKNIYAKLGVSSRYDAISWARKHDLIE